MTKTIFITGASSGLGLSHAIYLAYKGHDVIATYLPNEDIGLETLKNKFLRDNSKYQYVDKEKTRLKVKKTLAPKKLVENLDTIIKSISYYPVDITDNQSITRTVDRIQQIDVLINNAGLGYFGPVEELPLEKAINQFNVNYFGSIRMLQAIIPKMRERRSGQIINISSLGGVSCIPYQSHYSASKAAILRMTESLRIELKPFNIKVSAVLPGDINTTFNSNMVKLAKQGKNYQSTDVQTMLEDIPVNKNSPYYQQAKVVWEVIIHDLPLAPPPLVVSKKIASIINSKKPKVHYKVGNKFQTLGLTFIKRFLTESKVIWFLEKLWGL